jgi:hypothetical protein
MTSLLPPSTPAATDTNTPSEASAPSPQGGRRGRRGSRYPLIFGVTSVVLTLAAIALAVAAPALSPVASPFGDNWHKFYDSDSQQFSETWDTSKGCNVLSDGLHAGSGGHCLFKPSQQLNLTSEGFLIDVTVAPPGRVESEQRPIILIADRIFVGVNQTGSYIVCIQSCNTEISDTVVIGQADDWHAAANVENTIAVRVAPSDGTLQLFTNGQYVTTVSFGSDALFTASIVLGADDGSEAIFTHAAVYSASE